VDTVARIDDVPEEVTRAGLDFDYVVWTPGTIVTLANVPWNSDYRDVVRFSSTATLNNYINDDAGPIVTLNQMMYAIPGRPVRINIPFNAAYKYNYLRVFNPSQPVPGGDSAKTFYYFINDVRYIAPNSTELDIQLDVWQTFSRDITLGNCYIERGHFGIANEFANSDHGRGYLTVPEGLDVGGEYQIIHSDTETIGATQYMDNTKTFDIMMLTTVSLLTDPGTVDDPNLTTARGSAFQGLPNGGELYWFPDLASFNAFVTAVAPLPWVSQGIISIYAVPNLLEFGLSYNEVEFEGVTVRRVIGEPYPSTQLVFSVPENTGDWKAGILEKIPVRYRHLTKFMTYPYSVVEATTYSGTPLMLKPESIGSDIHLTFRMMLHLTPPGPRVAFYPENYNSLTGDNTVTGPETPGGDNNEFLDMITGIINLPTFSIVNNGYISFLASNANSLAYQHSSADWSQQKALTGAQTSFEQAGRGIGLGQQQTALTNRTNSAQTALQNQVAGQRAIVSGVNSAIGGIGGGAAGAAGAVVGVANAAADYAITTGANSAGSAITQQQNTRSNNLTSANAEYMRDSNLNYAEFAAQGDYQNAIAGIQAKVQDAQLIQPTSAGQVGGDAFNLAAYRWALHLKIKMVHSGVIRQVGDFWLRYGYAVNRFGQIPSDFHCMTNFTYWKLRETYITSSSCPEAFRQTIRGIFEKGVTVWRNAEDIGTIDIADNDPLEGISL